ncbi:MAG: hypothetical protein H0U59_09690 [Gemmatimonadaceae bacterium]|nr:hypothetical protein [Gemmatimonadaceae bacterium]
MPLLDVCKAVALTVGQGVPTQVIGAADRSGLEFQHLATEVGQRICWDSGIDWRELLTFKYYNLSEAISDAAGNFVSYALPSDYKRMPRLSHLFLVDDPRRPLYHCTDQMQWQSDTFAQVTINGGYSGMWMLLGQKVFVRPFTAATSGSHLVLPYISNRICQSWAQNVPTPPGVNTSGPAWLSDGHYFVLDERLLRLGMIWQWRSSKGSPYTEDMATFEHALTQAKADNGGTQEIIRTVENYLRRYNVAQSYPYAVPSVSPYPL